MVKSIPQHKKMELPSITREKQDMWRDVDDLYNSAYGLLGQAVVFVQAIVHNRAAELEHVNALTLANMVSSLNRDVTDSRARLNAIYTDITSKKGNPNLKAEDLFMMKMQLTQSINEWTGNYNKVIGQSIRDITDYTTVNSVETPSDLSE